MPHRARCAAGHRPLGEVSDQPARQHPPRGALSFRDRDAEYEAARRKVQTFLNAQEEREIIFTSGTTDSINLVMHGYGRKFIGRDDEIILTTLEHHSNIVPWQMLAEEKGAKIRVVPVNDRGELLLEEYKKLFNSRTRFVA